MFFVGALKAQKFLCNHHTSSNYWSKKIKKLGHLDKNPKISTFTEELKKKLAGELTMPFAAGADTRNYTNVVHECNVGFASQHKTR